jgi:hypothetical protein
MLTNSHSKPRAKRARMAPSLVDESFPFEALLPEIQCVVFSKLQPRELFRLGVCNKRLWAATLEHRGWQYYPFHLMGERTWASFFGNVWRSYSVQRVLLRKMHSWGTGNYYVGDDLWHYSQCSAWSDRISEQADEYVRMTHAFQRWRSAYAHEFAAGANGDEDDGADSVAAESEDLSDVASEGDASEREYDEAMWELFYESDEYMDIRKLFEPKPHSYEAQIMHRGANQLADVNLAAARLMFRNGGARIAKSETLWRCQLERQKRDNPHITDWSDDEEHGGDRSHMVVVVPKYNYIVDMVRNYCYEDHFDTANHEDCPLVSPHHMTRHFGLHALKYAPPRRGTRFRVKPRSWAQ